MEYVSSPSIRLGIALLSYKFRVRPAIVNITDNKLLVFIDIEGIPSDTRRALNENRRRIKAR